MNVINETLMHADCLDVFGVLFCFSSETEHSDRRERPPRDPQRGGSEQKRTGGTERVSAGTMSRRGLGDGFASAWLTLPLRLRYL